MKDHNSNDYTRFINNSPRCELRADNSLNKSYHNIPHYSSGKCECGGDLIHQGGCRVCYSCGFSQCD